MLTLCESVQFGRNRVVASQYAISSILPRIALYIPSTPTITTVRYYTQSSQLHSNPNNSSKSSNSNNIFASQVRSLLDSGDSSGAFSLLLSHAGDAFHYDEEIISLFADVLDAGALIHPGFSSTTQEQSWNSIIDKMPMPLLKSLVSDLMERHRGLEPSVILLRRAMVIFYRHHPARAPIDARFYMEIFPEFATLETDEIDVEWLLTQLQHSAFLRGDLLLPQA